MTFNVLVAEPVNAQWLSIASGIRRQRPDATILRVRDGEQALRFLLYKGLFTDDPQPPDLILLAAELSVVAAGAIVARVRQHPKICTVPVILVWRGGATRELFAMTGHFDGVFSIGGTDSLETEVADVVRHLCRRQAVEDAVCR